MDERREQLIRDAFLKIKQEMNGLSLKIEALNDNILSMKEDILEIRNNSASKDVATALEKSITELEANVHTKQAIDRQLTKLEQRIDSISSILDKHGKSLEEIREIPKLRKEMDAANEKYLSKSELKKLFDKLNEDLLFLDKRLSEIEDQTFYMDEIEKSFTSKKEFKETMQTEADKTKKTLQQVIEKLNKLDNDVAQIEDEAISQSDILKLEEDLALIRPKMAEKADIESLRSNLNRISKELAAVREAQEKSAAKESLDLVKKQVKVLIESMSVIQDMKRQLSELKKGHIEHKKTTKRLEKTIRPGKMKTFVQKLDPRRGI